MAVGKQHKEKFYHFQDNSCAESKSWRPIFSCRRGGRGSCKERTGLRWCWLGGEEGTAPWGGIRGPFYPSQLNWLQSLLCASQHLGVVMKKGCLATLN